MCLRIIEGKIPNPLDKKGYKVNNTRPAFNNFTAGWYTTLALWPRAIYLQIKHLWSFLAIHFTMLWNGLGSRVHQNFARKRSYLVCVSSKITLWYVIVYFAVQMQYELFYLGRILFWPGKMAWTEHPWKLRSIFEHPPIKIFAQFESWNFGSCYFSHGKSKLIACEPSKTEIQTKHDRFAPKWCTFNW